MKVQFVSAIAACALLVVAGHFSFCMACVKPQDQESTIVQGNYLIERDRGLINLDGPVRLETDGAHSEAGLVAPWHQIVGGNVGSELQERFQTRLTSFGQPLFLLRSRLARGDWSGANVAATTVEPWIDQDDVTTRSLVRFARFRSSVAAGNREQAVFPLLELCDGFDDRPGLKDSLLEDLCSDIELDHAIADLLVPVWTNQPQAADAWLGIQKNLPATDATCRAGWYVYGASLAIAAGDLAGAEELLKSWDAVSADDKLWKNIMVSSVAVALGHLVLAESELANLLESKRSELSPLQTATAKWWIGVCRYRQNLPLSAQTSFREMIAVAATNEKDWPSISESALQVALALSDSQNWERESFIVDRELQLLRSRILRYNLPSRH